MDEIIINGGDIRLMRQGNKVDIHEVIKRIVSEGETDIRRNGEFYSAYGKLDLLEDLGYISTSEKHNIIDYLGTFLVARNAYRDLKGKREERCEFDDVVEDIDEGKRSR